MVGRVGRQNFFLSIGVNVRGASPTAAIVDLESEMALTPCWGVSARFPGRALELFLPGNPFIVENILSILHTRWVSSGISASLATAGILGCAVGRLAPILVSYLLEI